MQGNVEYLKKKKKKECSVVQFFSFQKIELQRAPHLHLHYGRQRGA